MTYIVRPDCNDVRLNEKRTNFVIIEGNKRTIEVSMCALPLNSKMVQFP